MIEESPLTHAGRLASLATLARRPDPASDLAAAVARRDWTVRATDLEKGSFDDVQRALAVLLRRRVGQVETLRWLLAFARENETEFLRRVEAQAAREARREREST